MVDVCMGRTAACRGRAAGSVLASGGHAVPAVRAPTPGLDFVAVDVETANRHRASVCAIGLVRVRDGTVVKTANWLVRPPEEFDYFEERNTAVHGITATDLVSRPRFGEIHPRLLHGIEDEVLVAHNAAFDRGVLEAASLAEGLPVPRNVWACTRRLAQKELPRIGWALDNYRLPTVVAALGVSLGHHHDAGADSLAAAEVMIEMARLLGWSDLADVAA